MNPPDILLTPKQVDLYWQLKRVRLNPENGQPGLILDPNANTTAEYTRSSLVNRFADVARDGALNEQDLTVVFGDRAEASEFQELEQALAIVGQANGLPKELAISIAHTEVGGIKNRMVQNGWLVVSEENKKHFEQGMAYLVKFADANPKTIRWTPPMLEFVTGLGKLSDSSLDGIRVWKKGPSNRGLIEDGYCEVSELLFRAPWKAGFDKKLDEETKTWIKKIKAGVRAHSQIEGSALSVIFGGSGEFNLEHTAMQKYWPEWVISRIEARENVTLQHKDQFVLKYIKKNAENKFEQSRSYKDRYGFWLDKSHLDLWQSILTRS